LFLRNEIRDSLFFHVFLQHFRKHFSEAGSSKFNIVLPVVSFHVTAADVEVTFTKLTVITSIPPGSQRKISCNCDS